MSSEDMKIYNNYLILYKSESENVLLQKKII